jgi:hypothetical protein
MMRAIILGLIAFLLFQHEANADSLIGFAGDPKMCFIAVGLESTDNMLRVLPLGRTPSRDCDVTPAMLEEALKSAFDWLATEGQGVQPKLIYLGRLYDYPWLSQGLTAWAADHPDWDGENGRPAQVGVYENDVVAGIVALMVMEPLSESAKVLPDVRTGLSFLPELLNRHGYRFERASVEKVMSGYDGQLFAPSDRPDAKRLPFDALVHLRIAKTP